MAYLSLADAKTYLGIASSDTSDDALLNLLLVAAQAAIDHFCDRTFEATASTGRTFDASIAVRGPLLLLDRDLAQVDSITNGDTAATMITSADYLTLPADPPYQALYLKPTTGIQWTGTITVSGRWAYSILPPAPIIHAMREYLTTLYRSYSQQASQTRQLAPTAALPAHLMHLLDGYRRLA
ncbi:MAG: hypothetical protein HC876_19145 [Chloroflexaceae bacterium]|nr:hypothetical protein [Chloroflexaceae bacterium]NJO07452.1 hypothetical protein [Chloroflexaceae bacterium]